MVSPLTESVWGLTRYLPSVYFQVTVQLPLGTFLHDLDMFPVCLSSVSGDRSGVDCYVFKWFECFSGVRRVGGFIILSVPPPSPAAAPSGSPADRI